MYISLWENYRGHPDNISFMQFSTKIDGFEQQDSQGFENSYNSYEQYPLEKFFIFTIYQNYTLALSIPTQIMKEIAGLECRNAKTFLPRRGVATGEGGGGLGAHKFSVPPPPPQLSRVCKYFAPHKNHAYICIVKICFKIVICKWLFLPIHIERNLALLLCKNCKIF